MRYYIASGLDNWKKVRELKTVLDARGWQHTYDWTAHGAVGLDELRKISEKEVRGVIEAEVVIVLLPGGRGTHTELGIALGGLCANLEDRIVIYSADPGRDFGTKGATCAFYHHPLVERFGDWDEMIATFLPECRA